MITQIKSKKKKKKKTLLLLLLFLDQVPQKEGHMGLLQEEWEGVKPSFCHKKWMDSQFSSVAQSCPTLCDPMDCSTPGLPVHHQLLEFTQIHVH